MQRATGGSGVHLPGHPLPGLLTALTACGRSVSAALDLDLVCLRGLPERRRSPVVVDTLSARPVLRWLLKRAPESAEVKPRVGAGALLEEIPVVIKFPGRAYRPAALHGLDAF